MDGNPLLLQNSLGKAFLRRRHAVYSESWQSGGAVMSLMRRNVQLKLSSAKQGSASAA
ncbi:hypothetical protein M2323_000249 [Rhodoblastus acidophilus]|uniref:hypothetical protein n=1 Tax=Rhodoblastus acidophilus TaxID=1074 RepID=UPI0022248FCF|nr:hypothetical protein [Rhodoblastus acidophilus]MCW2282244.1 hypothetical protein [Rhodoblastus acidophilus]MCW2331351.1 hypothetical protein [Rhodoblastus acidophilus]